MNLSLSRKTEASRLSRRHNRYLHPARSDPFAGSAKPLCIGSNPIGASHPNKQCLPHSSSGRCKCGQNAPAVRRSLRKRRCFHLDLGKGKFQAYDLCRSIIAAVRSSFPLFGESILFIFPSNKLSKSRKKHLEVV